MHFRLFSLMVAATLSVASVALAEQRMASVYTDISERTCKKTVNDELTGASTSVCRGIGGFSLHVLNDDERSSVSVVSPDRQVFPLDYWNVVTHDFSNLGARAEWRVTTTNGKHVPVALIVHVNAVDQSDLDHLKRVPLLAVAKIRSDAACVVGKIDALLPDAKQRAISLADAKNLACLK